MAINACILVCCNRTGLFQRKIFQLETGMHLDGKCCNELAKQDLYHFPVFSKYKCL